MSDVSNGLMEMDGCVFNGIKYMLSFSFIITFLLPNEELDIRIRTFQSMVGSARYIYLNLQHTMITLQVTITQKPDKYGKEI